MYQQRLPKSCERVGLNNKIKYMKTIVSFLLITILAANGAQGQTEDISIEYVVPETVPFVVQPKSNHCWAAAITMLYSWHDRLETAYPIDKVLDKAGSNYKGEYYDKNKVIPAKDFIGCIEALGMSKGASKTYTMLEIIDMLKAHGPLGVFTLNTGATVGHVYVIYGLNTDSDGNHFIIHHDPASPAGEAQSMELSMFYKIYANGASSNWNVVYYD
jgi:hypothetical protein